MSGSPFFVLEIYPSVIRLDFSRESVLLNDHPNGERPLARPFRGFSCSTLVLRRVEVFQNCILLLKGGMDVYAKGPHGFDRSALRDGGFAL